MRTSWWTLAVLLTAVGCGSAGSGVGGVGGSAGGGGTGNAAGGGAAGVGNAPGGGAAGVGNAPGGGGVGNAPGGGGVGNAPGGGGVGNAPGGGGVGNAPGGGGVGNAPGGGGVGNAPGGGGVGNAPGGGGTGGGGGVTCNGYCGNGNAVPNSNPACYCDSACKQYNDCCSDYDAICGGGGTGGAGGTGGTGGTGATGGTGGGTTTLLDLRADVNRDGNVDTSGTSDETGEDTWNQTRGAIFLANIDDDDNSCPKSGTDAQLAACNDATNSTIDGSGDLADLARLRTVAWPSAPANAAATISVSPSVAASRVRLFKNTGSGFTAIPNGASLTSAELKAGVEFGIEGTDIRRDTSWDGYLNVTVNMTAGGSGSDTVRMRMSPVMLSHHVQDATSIYVTPFNSTASQAFRSDMQAACSGSGSTYTDLPSGLGDQWTQDYFETGYMSMPAAGGAQKIIRVYFRSANYTTNGLRSAGKVVYTYFHGPDRAGVTHYDPNHPNGADTLNSFGNTETIPPFSGYPLGRIMRGSVSNFYPDQAFEGMLTAQGMQPQVFIDTSWLAVAHVDETISFAKVNSPRGWVMLVNDAALAKQMLQTAQSQGYGNTPMFVGKTYSNGSSAQITINQVLADSNVMGASNEAVAEVNAQVAVLKSATGITDSEIVKIPFLHWKSGGYSVAFQPGTVNYTYVGPKTIAAPKAYGPVINGQDIFQKQMQDVLAPYGISVKWVENWDLYHRLLGEVHCGSNADRAVTVKWWETGK